VDQKKHLLPAEVFNSGSRLFRNLTSAGIGLITLLVLWPCLGDQFTNWDDTSYVLSNNLIKDFTPIGLWQLFTTSLMGNYHPFTALTYAIEYHFVQAGSFFYHFDNLVLHIIATLLVYQLIIKLTGKQVVAMITALLFGLHPMHVESVAWISGRKDVLYAVFYLAACLFYLQNLRQEKVNRRAWWYCLIFFICALLSKPVAVTLPLTLLLIDYFENGGIGKKDIIGKLPFFALSLFFGCLAIYFQRHAGAVNSSTEHYAWYQQITLGAYALFTYLWKALLPVHLVNFYPYPTKIAGSLPSFYYLFLPGVAIAIAAVWLFFRKNKVVVFGLLFFGANIALLLQFIPVGDAIIAERYTYIPYIGLFFVAANWVAGFFESGVKKNTRQAVMAVLLLYSGWLAYQSHVRSKIWFDSISLWSDALEKEPGQAQVVYDNLGAIYFDKWYNATNKEERKVYYDSALFLMSKSVEIWPEILTPYQGLGMLYYSKRKFDAANFCFKTALRLNPTPEAHVNYGNFLDYIGQPDSAYMEFSTALDMNPESYIALMNRGKILTRQGQWMAGIKDLSEAIKIQPTLAEAFYQRAICDTGAGITAQAVRDLEKAISLGYKKVDSNFYKALIK